MPSAFVALRDAMVDGWVGWVGVCVRAQDRAPSNCRLWDNNLDTSIL